MKKILHISNDDKFICLGKTIFDAVKDVENDYWINSGSASFEYVTFEAKNLYEVDFEADAIVALINSYDLLCIHFLNQNLYPLLQSNQIKTPIWWIGWGGDYYWLLDTYHNFELFLPKTRAWLTKSKAANLLKPFIKKLKKFKRSKKYHTVNRINYFAPVNAFEYEIIKDNYPDFSPEFIDWNYGYINQAVIQHYAPLYRSGNQVMIGNSATPSNNHLDILYDLSDILQREEIILPLSYGNTHYAKHIEKVAKSKFSEIEILDKFMVNSDFDKMLLNCKALIIGSYRQQAVGTIITALYMGVTVFLYEDSINYKFFSHNGFSVFTIEQLKADEQFINKKLDKETIEQHRNLINQIWSLERNIKTIENILRNL